ncbi:hypothetical protein DF3PA_140050 [Candidatus Defluviicoccus seviourii]|uniref:Uncharacterized protein n=1 Tax=Candidatus Defluviicoccus seviourii TaxID=2565273 RepID=A0A564WC29_9PROT|nr:hypothetical protein DF3PA_140050 [Candidatus Defluviicoccus seviourii]
MKTIGLSLCYTPIRRRKECATVNWDAARDIRCPTNFIKIIRLHGTPQPAPWFSLDRR